MAGRLEKGVNRGIFGMTSAKRSEIHGLVELLESRNPTPDPTDKLQEKVQNTSQIFKYFSYGNLKCQSYLALLPHH